MSYDAILIEEDKEVPYLYSKSSIFIVSLLSSPFLAAVLFSINLLKVGSKSKIIGSVLLISCVVFFLRFPLMGFEGGIPFYLLYKIFSSLFIIGPLWKASFEKTTITTHFPVVIVICSLVIWYSYEAYHLIAESYKYSDTQLDFYIPSFGIMLQFLFLFLAVALLFLFRVIQGLIKLLKPKKADQR